MEFVKQHEEDARFWRLFNFESAPQKAYETINEWNLWLIDLSKARAQERKAPVVLQMQNYKEEVREEQYYKPRLFTYPDFSKSATIFDEDEQQENAFLVLCVRAHEEKDIEEDSVYVWRGPIFEEEDGAIDCEEYIDKVIE